jgi:hypothetical protein
VTADAVAWLAEIVPSFWGSSPTPDLMAPRRSFILRSRLVEDQRDYVGMG